MTMIETGHEYDVKLEVFEGPLDLLVYLVQKNELDPLSISIAVIADQYLEHLQKGIPNLSAAGEFLLMAARLMRLKVREMLPQEEQDVLEIQEDALDKGLLMQQMMEHRKFQQVARMLQTHEMHNWGALARSLKERLPGERPTAALPEEGSEAGIYELLSAYWSAVKHRRRRVVHQVQIDDVTIENQLKAVQTHLRTSPRCQFEEIHNYDPRPVVVVVTLMALLELCRLDHLIFRQQRRSGPIWVYRRQGLDAFLSEVLQEPMENWADLNLRADLVDYVRGETVRYREENPLEQVLRELRELPLPALRPVAETADTAIAA